MRLSILLTTAYALSACTGEINPKNERIRAGDVTYASSEMNEEPSGKSPSGNAGGDPFASLKLNVAGLPTDKSDEIEFDLLVSGDSKVTYYSYKLAPPSECTSGKGFKVLPITSSVKLTVPEELQGDIAVCLLAFHEPSKTWQQTKDAFVHKWERIPFQRTIKSQYSEFDAGCGKEIVTKTEISFVGKGGTYKYVRDAKAQGCDQAIEEGEDKINVAEISKDGISGFWSYQGVDSSGWFKFTWSNKEKTAFKGTFGYGDPSLAPAGEWNSVDP